MKSIREDDHLRMNGLQVVHKDTGCCPLCFLLSLVVGEYFPVRIAW